MPALAVWTPEDGILAAVAPLALGLAAGVALVVDLDPAGPRYPGSGSLASLVAEGPRAADLEPSRRGVAVLRNGGIDPGDAAAVVAAIVARWPNVVLRLPPRPEPGREAPAPVVPVLPLLPGSLRPLPRPVAVYQRSGWPVPPPGPGPVLPRPRPATLGLLAAGGRPLPDRWLRSWRQVWGVPWG